MEHDSSERRRELRFPITAGACVEVKGHNGLTTATTIDVSGGGVLLRYEGAQSLAVGDQVTCEFLLPQDQGQPLPYWGVGSVVRVRGNAAAVDLIAGGFAPLDHRVCVKTHISSRSLIGDGTAYCVPNPQMPQFQQNLTRGHSGLSPSLSGCPWGGEFSHRP